MSVLDRALRRRGGLRRSRAFEDLDGVAPEEDDAAIEANVDMNIDRIFPSTSPQLIDCIMLGGKNLRDTMIADRKALLASGRQRASDDYFPVWWDSNMVLPSLGWRSPLVFDRAPPLLLFA